MSFLPLCASCGVRSNDKVPHKECGGCRKVAYCSRNCQKKHWATTHKGVCDKSSASSSGAAKPKLGNQVKCEKCGETYSKGLNLQLYGCSCWKKKAAEHQQNEEKGKGKRGVKQVDNEQKEHREEKAHNKKEDKNVKHEKPKPEGKVEEKIDVQQDRPVVLPSISAAGGMQIFNAHLAVHAYVQGFNPTQDDLAVYVQFPREPEIDVAEFPHVARWYKNIHFFPARDRTRWPVAKQRVFEGSSSTGAPKVAQVAREKVLDQQRVSNLEKDKRDKKKDKKDKKKGKGGGEEQGSKKPSEDLTSDAKGQDVKPASRKASEDLNVEA